MSLTNFAAHQPWNLFQLMSSSITGDSENGSDLFLIFLEITIFLGHDLRKSRDAAPYGADFQKKGH